MIDKLLADIKRMAEHSIETTLAESEKKYGKKSYAYVTGTFSVKLTEIASLIATFETIEPLRRLLEAKGPS